MFQKISQATNVSSIRVFDMGVTSRIQMELPYLNNKDMNSKVTKEDAEMVNEHMKTCSAS